MVLPEILMWLRLFLLIFALFGLSYLNGQELSYSVVGRICNLAFGGGTFLMCDLATEPGLAKELGQDRNRIRVTG